MRNRISVAVVIALLAVAISSSTALYSRTALADCSAINGIDVVYRDQIKESGWPAAFYVWGTEQEANCWYVFYEEEVDFGIDPLIFIINTSAYALVLTISYLVFTRKEKSITFG